MEGYDHIIDIGNDEPIWEIARMRGFSETAKYIEGVAEFENNRERLHRAIRVGNLDDVQRYVELNELLAYAKNYYGRCSLHIAVLKEQEDIVEYLASTVKPLLKIGDNVSPADALGTQLTDEVFVFSPD